MVRLLRFLNAYHGASTIMTFIEAAPQIQNVLTLVALILFIYAALGINLFGTVMYKNYYSEQSNFSNIFEAAMLLMRCLTGEDWNGIMYDLASMDDFKGQKCKANQTYDEMQEEGTLGCGSWIAYPFFISFFILNSIVILDLSIGVFISALEEAKKNQKLLFGKKELTEFIELWSDYDPNGTGWVHVNQLLFIIFELPLPYGKGKISPEHIMHDDHDRIYAKLTHENQFILKTMQDKEDGLLRYIWEIDIERTIHNDIYYVNYTKGLSIRDTGTASMLRHFNIPIYEGQLVNFKHVLRQVITNSFKNLEEDYLPDMVIQSKFEMKMKVKTKKVKLVHKIDEFMVARMLWNKYMISKEKRLDKFDNSLGIDDRDYKDARRDRTDKIIPSDFHKKNPFYRNRSNDSVVGKFT
jgi:hypothetical protein